MTSRFKIYGPILIVFVFVVAWFFGTTLYQERHDSALLRAINARDVGAVERAFKDGATMTMPIRRHFTFLQVAARVGDVGIARLLVAHSAAQTLDARNDDGQTALDIAQANGHAEMAEYLRSLIATNHAKDVP